MAYEKSCKELVDCLFAGVRTKQGAFWSETLITLAGSAFIELMLAFLWHAGDDNLVEEWLEESLITTAAAAVFVIIVSTTIRCMHYRFDQDYFTNQLQKNEPEYIYLAIILSQIISGAIAFGVGVGADAALDSYYKNRLPHNMTPINSTKTIPTATPIIGTIVLVAIKSLTRWGIFRAITGIDDSCCLRNKHELEIEQKLLDEHTTCKTANASFFKLVVIF